MKLKPRQTTPERGAGGATTTIFEARPPCLRLFDKKEATLKSASAVILVHNHPSGETEPSEEDIKLTKNIVESCNLIGVKVLDHIIVGRETSDYFPSSRALHLTISEEPAIFNKIYTIFI